MLIETIIIFALAYSGLLLEQIFKIPMPSTVIGMVIFFILLHFKVLELSKVEKVGNFLLANMMLFLLPGMVRVITYLGDLKSEFIKIIFLLIITTAITMAVTAKTVHYMILFLEKRKKQVSK